ncbi:hypothetical protein [Bradyrhizobium sp. AZCC 1721]|uniref:hypothetical protein n=1 Tax=Bradyrhizobium sp. AZCC 1721 TaxID=3117016 RepID=UPI002FEF59A5
MKDHRMLDVRFRKSKRFRTGELELQETAHRIAHQSLVMRASCAPARKRGGCIVSRHRQLGAIKNFVVDIALTMICF